MKNLKLYYNGNMEVINQRQRKYRDDNKVKESFRHKKWNKENEQKIKDKRKENITCECGAELSRAALTKHKKSEQN